MAEIGEGSHRTFRHSFVAESMCGGQAEFLLGQEWAENAASEFQYDGPVGTSRPLPKKSSHSRGVTAKVSGEDKHGVQAEAAPHRSAAVASTGRTAQGKVEAVVGWRGQ